MTTPIALSVKAKRFFRGNQDVQVLKQGKDLAQSRCAEGGGCWLGKKNAIKNMNNGRYIKVIFDKPFQGIGQLVEEKGGTSEALSK